jgi:transcriptional regulator with XRE-family HTH domain
VILPPLSVKREQNGAKQVIWPEQVRAGRGLIGWSRERLAGESGVPLRTLSRIESGETTRPRGRTMQALAAALRSAGVAFIDPNGGGPGVRLTRQAAIERAVRAAKGE